MPSLRGTSVPDTIDFLAALTANGPFRHISLAILWKRYEIEILLKQRQDSNDPFVGLPQTFLLRFSSIYNVLNDSVLMSHMWINLTSGENELLCPCSPYQTRQSLCTSSSCDNIIKSGYLDWTKLLSNDVWKEWLSLGLPGMIAFGVGWRNSIWEICLCYMILNVIDYFLPLT